MNYYILAINNKKCQMFVTFLIRFRNSYYEKLIN